MAGNLGDGVNDNEAPSTAQRIAQYRQFALVSMQRAQASTFVWQRESYLQIARDWNALADHLEIVR